MPIDLKKRLEENVLSIKRGNANVKNQKMCRTDNVAHIQTVFVNRDLGASVGEGQSCGNPSLVQR